MMSDLIISAADAVSPPIELALGRFYSPRATSVLFVFNLTLDFTCNSKFIMKRHRKAFLFTVNNIQQARE